ncbi:unnamed protein product [Caenorhabditis angaria]|uniref:PAN-3 domain-containing protein n=1 Tax=Caenorhabditis angaria TaxID=860376 RepID=A0A9P1MXX1_9PELO|nr:unnamed protein product [Caenorhabditis angaria]
MLRLFVTFVLIGEIRTAYVSISGRVGSTSKHSFNSTDFYDFNVCKSICDNFTVCQAFYYNNITMVCTTYDYPNLVSILQLDVYPPTEILTFKLEKPPVTEIFAFQTNTTICAISLDTIYYSNHYSYTNNGTNWDIEGVCPNGWSKFTRAKGAWCMKLYYSSGRSLE